MDHNRQLELDRRQVEERLEGYFTGQGLEQAMRYSLLAGGKRIRPILTLAFCRAAGGEAEEALDFACGVEMLHTYSLIHDDLPCMDDDDLRRGKPTCHKQFGECTAVLAGDALQAAAFETVLCAPGPWADPSIPGLAAQVLARAAGERGMCAGQYWDTLEDGLPHTLEQLSSIHKNKTGALLEAACRMGVLASRGHRPVEDFCVESAGRYAAALGMAFQIQDDILDAISTTEALGKPVGSDAAKGKTTFVTLLGVEGCEERVERFTRQAVAALEEGSWPGDTGFLRWLAQRLAKRKR